MLIAFTVPVPLLGRGVPAAAHATRHHPLDQQARFAVDLRDARCPLLQICREPLNPEVERLNYVRIGGIDQTHAHAERSLAARVYTCSYLGT